MGESVTWYRRLLSGVGRAFSAGFVLALTGGLIAMAAAIDVQPEPIPDPQEIDVGAAPLTLGCAPVPVLPTGDGGDIDYDEEFASSGVTQTRTAFVIPGRAGSAPDPAAVGPLGEQPKALAATGTARLSDESEPTPSVLLAQPSTTKTALAAGASVARADTGDLRGLSAATCQQPTSSAWLVGGQTEPGSSARLTLVNPGTTPVTTTIQVWGATGPVEGELRVAIPPGESRTRLLESTSLEPRIATRVQATGGRITASIQETVLDGLTPQGTDVVTASSDPAEELLIGPFPVAKESDTAVLRLVNPGAQPATFDVQVLGASGPTRLAGADALVVEPGTVSDISLDGIEPGPVSLQVTSDEPLAGAVRISRQGQAAPADPDAKVTDRAWLPATTPADHGLIPLAGLDTLVDRAAIAVSNTTDTTQEVSLRPIRADGAAGKALDITLEAGATVRFGTELSLKDAVAVEVTGAEILAAAILVSSPENGVLVSLLPMTPDAHSDQSIAVRVGTH